MLECPRLMTDATNDATPLAKVSAAVDLHRRGKGRPSRLQRTIVGGRHEIIDGRRPISSR